MKRPPTLATPSRRQTPSTNLVSFVHVYSKKKGGEEEEGGKTLRAVRSRAASTGYIAADRRKIPFLLPLPSLPLSFQGEREKRKEREGGGKGRRCLSVGWNRSPVAWAGKGKEEENGKHEELRRLARPGVYQ